MSDNAKKNMLPPWQVSLGYAGLGLFFTLCLFFFPGLRRLHLSSGTSIATPFLVMAVPVLASLWAIAGIFWKRADRNRRWCFLSLAVALATVALAFLAYWTDPFRLQ